MDLLEMQIKKTTNSPKLVVWMVMNLMGSKSVRKVTSKAKSIQETLEEI